MVDSVSLAILKIHNIINNDSNIYSDDLAQQRADYELRKFGILKTTMNINIILHAATFATLFHNT